MNIKKNNQLTILLSLGILAAVLLASSDYLMIYGDTTYESKLVWLTLGVAQIPEERNAIAMLIAFIAIIFYCFGIFGVRHLFKDAKAAKNYTALSIVGLTPWLCLHLFYVMILFNFAWLMHNTDSTIAYSLCEATFNQFAWLIPLAEVIMLLPYVYIFVEIVRSKTNLTKIMAINNPILIFIVLKLISSLLPDIPFRLAFINGLMSEAMIVWFLVYIIYIKKRGLESENQ